MFSFQEILTTLNSLANKKQAEILQRFFKTGPGEYGEGDIFLGIKVPQQRKVAIQYSSVALNVVAQLLKSKIHECRLVALLILVKKYELATEAQDKEKIFNFYVKNLKAINNWDLVDLSAPKTIGHFLFNYYVPKNQVTKKFLSELADSNNIWERRIAIISTFYFIYQGSASQTFYIAKKLLADKHDLIHKAVGWMLREVGKRIDNEMLVNFLNIYQAKMSRTTLRYAIEHFSEPERRIYLTRKH